MKRLDIELRANTVNCDYSWKMFCKCSTVEQLEAMRNCIVCYMDMKISEAKSEGINTKNQ